MEPTANYRSTSQPPIRKEGRATQPMQSSSPLIPLTSHRNVGSLQFPQTNSERGEKVGGALRSSGEQAPSQDSYIPYVVCVGGCVCWSVCAIIRIWWVLIVGLLFVQSPRVTLGEWGHGRGQPLGVSHYQQCPRRNQC